MKALTLHQPWASLIAVGVKTIETRSWSTKHRGSLAIHAGKQLYTAADKHADRGLFFAAHDVLALERNNGVYDLPYGAIVATAEVVACVPIHQWLCRCDHADGIYALVRPTSMHRGNIVGLFEAPSGKGGRHNDGVTWAAERKALVDLVAAERQRADAAETIAEDWRYRADEWRMDAHAQERIACALDPARRVS